MSIIWTYGAGIATIILAFLSLFEDFYSRKNSFRRVGITLVLIIATVVTLISIRASDIQHAEDENKIAELHTQISNLQGLVRESNQTEKDTSKQLSDARASDTTKFLSEFDKLSTRVANLQAQVSTTDLKAEAEKLQGDLESTRRAMLPDKARMTFTLDGSEPDLHIIALEQHENVVHLKVTIQNNSDADALNGDVILTICDPCKFKSEPTGMQHLNGAPETQRNISFERSLAHTSMPMIEFDVQTPDFPFQISVAVICHTCVAANADSALYSSSLATIYASNPRAQPPSKYPPIPVHPFFGPTHLHR